MPASKTSDYFAELYVAGRLADAGWNVYFPHRDQGFDFIISKAVKGEQVIRPVQVKGKYPSGTKGDWPTYGYIGTLSQLHPEMVLAIPFFSSASNEMPAFTAYMPRSLIRKHSRGYRCQPATFKDGHPLKRRDYARFFGQSGIELIESPSWKILSVTKSA